MCFRHDKVSHDYWMIDTTKQSWGYFFLYISCSLYILLSTCNFFWAATCCQSRQWCRIIMKKQIVLHSILPWLTAGTILAVLRRFSVFVIVKLEIPIAFTELLATSSSIAYIMTEYITIINISYNFAHSPKKNFFVGHTIY